MYVFYRFFHPWKSEGVSVGFEPGRGLRDDMRKDVYELRENATLDRMGDMQKRSSEEKRGFYGMSTLIIFFR